MKIIGVVLAKEDSKRLQHKNMLLINEKPIFMYAVESLVYTKLIDKPIYVSTDSRQIKEIANNNSDIKVLSRHSKLCAKSAGMQEVFKDIDKTINDYDIMVSVKANCPEVFSVLVEDCIRMLINNNLEEVRVVDGTGLETGVVWVMKKSAVLRNGLSVYFGVVQSDVREIHTEEDYEVIKESMELP